MKIQQMNADIFSNQTLLELTDYFLRFNICKYYLPKAIIDNYNVIIVGKTFMKSN